MPQKLFMALTFFACLVLPGVAHAAPQITKLMANGTLTVTGDGFSDVLRAYDYDANTVAIQGTAGINDPDGVDNPVCGILNTTTIVCSDPAVDAIEIKTYGGLDSVTWERDAKADVSDQGRVYGGLGLDVLTVTGPGTDTKRLYGEEGDDTLTKGSSTTLDGGADADILQSNADGDGLDRQTSAVPATTRTAASGRHRRVQR